MESQARFYLSRASRLSRLSRALSRLWLSIPCGGSWAHNREYNDGILFHVTATAVDSPNLGE